MAARLAKLHAIDVEYKRTRFVFKGMLLPWTRTLQAQNCRRCACAELSALCVCRVPCGEGGVPEPRAWRAGHHVSLPGRPNRHRRPRVAQVRSSSWKFMTWSMSLAPQGQLHFRVVVTGGYKGKWVWADREVYDTGVQITRLCFPCDTHEWR